VCSKCLQLAYVIGMTIRVTRRSLTLLALAAAGTMAAACAPRYPGPSGLGVLPVTPPSPLWMGAVRPQTDANMRGAAAITATPTPNYSHVLVSIWGGTPGRSYDWTLHSGSCGSTGAAIPVNGYPLVTYADGTAKAEGYVPQKLIAGSQYSVVIGAQDAAAPPACADLAYGSM
jgi:hypothetical protein